MGQKLFLSSGWEGRVFSPRWICPSSFLAPPNALPAGPARQRAKDVPSRPIRAVAARGGSACALCRHSAVASATRGESRRRSRRKKSAAVSVLTSSPKIRRAFLARAIGLSSALHRTVGVCAGQLTPLRGSLPARAGEATCGRSGGGRGAAMPRLPIRKTAADEL